MEIIENLEENIFHRNVIPWKIVLYKTNLENFTPENIQFYLSPGKLFLKNLPLPPSIKGASPETLCSKIFFGILEKFLQTKTEPYFQEKAQLQKILSIVLFTFSFFLQSFRQDCSSWYPLPVMFPFYQKKDIEY